MAHETRIHSSYVDGYIMLRADLEALDAKQFRSINGVKGGTWAPSSTMQIGGSGLVCSGPLVIQGDGVVTVDAGASISLADDDFQDLAEGHVGRERVLVVGTVPALSVGPYPWLLTVNRRFMSVQPICLTLAPQGADPLTPEILIPLRVHDGATLSKVVFSFRVPELRKAAPVTMPRFRVFRRDALGNVDELQTTPSGDGFASPTNPGSADGWYAGGEAQTFEYECDVNNVIDVAQYTYFANIVEESGATDYPAKLVLYTGSNVAAMAVGVANGDVYPDGATHGKATPDGVVMGYGSSDLFLYRSSVSSVLDAPATAQGVYRTAGDALSGWPRAPGFDTDAALSDKDGMLFAVAGGTTQGGTIWQLSVPPNPHTAASAPASDNMADLTKLSFHQPTPHGNVYLPMALHFTGIESTRWQ